MASTSATGLSDQQPGPREQSQGKTAMRGRAVPTQASTSYTSCQSLDYYGIPLTNTNPKNHFPKKCEVADSNPKRSSTFPPILLKPPSSTYYLVLF
ncbi:hypothetical protein EYF80_007706 [Liparis tanakae]|uniref:Uncharacterized protein n=1 Tax=Liparis tanakae TaxID=230148 RepID=A0A4Z2IVT1_9TELE|nr:hypothetical protein EYF80_007706 [Liparis tanakae]